MKRFSRLFVMVLGVLSLHVPVASGCAGVAGMMATDCLMTGATVAAVSMPDDCPMADMTARASHADEPTESGQCTDCGRISDECCGIESTRRPVEVRAVNGPQLGTVLTLADLPVTTALVPTARSPEQLPPDDGHLNELGRYSILSALLL
jgi:hypothetical protein